MVELFKEKDPLTVRFRDGRVERLVRVALVLRLPPLTTTHSYENKKHSKEEHNSNRGRKMLARY